MCRRYSTARYYSRIFLFLCIIVLWVAASDKLTADEPECYAEVEKNLRTNDLSRPLLSCKDDSSHWVFWFHRARPSQMMDGTALAIFHMPHPNGIPAEDLPLSIVLKPLSSQVWYIGYMHDGKELPPRKIHRYYMWAPGDNRSVWNPSDVEWGDDMPRMFRCVAYEGESCITYYSIKNCKKDEASKLQYVLSVRRKDDMHVVDMLGSFESADVKARMIVNHAETALCDGGE